MVRENQSGKTRLSIGQKTTMPKALETPVYPDTYSNIKTNASSLCCLECPKIELSADLFS